MRIQPFCNCTPLLGRHCLYITHMIHATSNTVAEVYL